VSESFALKVVAGFCLALVVALLVPRAGWGGDSPPVGALLSVAALVTVFTTGALYLGLRRDLNLPTRVALYAVAFNMLIVVVKFVLGPFGLYEVNRTVDLTSQFPIDDVVGAVWTAGLVFFLYLLGYYLVYRLASLRIRRLSRDGGGRERARRTVLVFVAAAYAVAGAGVALAVVVLVGGSSASIDQYLEFAFSSSVSVLIAVALAGAGSLAALAFRDTAEQAEVVADAALLSTLFWVGLAFLALYHALWVVYVLVITAVWPLKVVVPK
jgi:hypothetical protein